MPGKKDVPITPSGSQDIGLTTNQGPKINNSPISWWETADHTWSWGSSIPRCLLLPAPCLRLPGLSCLHLAPTSFFLAALCGLLLSSETWDGAAQVSRRPGHLAVQGLVTSNKLSDDQLTIAPPYPASLGVFWLFHVISCYFWFMCSKM